jgi:hypothetical protein
MHSVYARTELRFDRRTRYIMPWYVDDSNDSKVRYPASRVIKRLRPFKNAVSGREGSVRALSSIAFIVSLLLEACGSLL